MYLCDTRIQTTTSFIGTLFGTMFWETILFGATLYMGHVVTTCLKLVFDKWRPVKFTLSATFVRVDNNCWFVSCLFKSVKELAAANKVVATCSALV